jgi:thiosulfate/3-mercaptopyruvate sulfurtransferase
MTASFKHPELIVETAWLADHLTDPGVVLLDGTTHLMPPPPMPYNVVSGRADFERGHIPGAQFVDIDADLSDPHQPPGLHFMLPSAERFAAAMGRLGISNETMVVCYATANHWWATRLWWMLRVFGHDRAAVLNGGFQRWQAEGRPIEAGPGKDREATEFTARFRPELVADRNDVLSAIGAGEICTLNALRPEQHAGTGGTAYGRLGHIKGSINVPAVNVVDADNLFRSAAELHRMFEQPLAKPRVITYCGGGIAATSATLVLTMFGHGDVRVYDASMSEWAPDPTLPMETGG